CLNAELGVAATSTPDLSPGRKDATRRSNREDDDEHDKDDKDDKGRCLRVVVATHTISLQEQLIQKDLPLLNAVIPLEFSAVLVKGRGNYLSKRRLANALDRAQGMFRLPNE